MKYINIQDAYSKESTHKNLCRINFSFFFIQLYFVFQYLFDFSFLFQLKLSVNRFGQESKFDSQQISH